jgi:phosphoglycerol transferase MdoB-like AlkP superfamily enzyme
MKNNARFNYLICIYLVGMVFFTLFRLAETVAYCATTEGSDDFGGLYGKALWLGFRFDSAVSAYVLALPLLLLIIGEMARIVKRWYYAVIHYLTMTLYTVCFFACAADIPYFCFFFMRIDVTSLAWFDAFGTTMSMLLTDPEYLAYLLAFVAVSVGWWFLGRFLYRRVLLPVISSPQPAAPYYLSIPIALLILFAGFTAMRGHLTKARPLNTGHAYYCNKPFLNQIGLNPAFTFMKSIEDAGKSYNQPVELVDAATAAEVLAEQRAWPVDSTVAESSLQLPEGMNVVVVIMESMSAAKTSLYGSSTSLTPRLDSLMNRSLTFREAYTAGIHTHNGIYSTLYSHPAIMARQTMKNSPIPRMCGLPHALREAGYSTTYFMTHDEDYDNMQGFLYQNGFDRVVGEHSYPKEEIKGTWGVPDHVMLEHAIEHIDSSYRKGPVFACCMTCSDHSPFYLPDDISLVHRRTEMGEKVVEYADWSLGHFIQLAESKPWFDNTLFVFIADHGALLSHVYDMSLTHNHAPLLFFAPGKIEPHFDDRLALQIDIAPTILGLLGITAPAPMLGVNLFAHTRPYAFFSADDRIGAVDGEYFFLYRAKTQKASLYRYKEQSTVDLVDSLPDRAAALRRYAFGIIQASQQMLLDGSTHCEQ